MTYIIFLLDSAGIESSFTYTYFSGHQFMTHLVSFIPRETTCGQTGNQSQLWHGMPACCLVPFPPLHFSIEVLCVCASFTIS